MRGLEVNLAFVCSYNARLARNRVASVTSMTTVAELVSWIKIDQHAWQETASRLADGE